MDPKFTKLLSDPWNDVFQVVFFPDRIYHAQYLNASRSVRYRYNVQEVRGKADINVLKGDVYFDGVRLCSFLRVEYRGARLAEIVRERSRFLGPSVLADVEVLGSDGQGASARVRMNHCPWVNAFQVELWGTLEPPPGKRHDFQVLDLMGHHGSITRRTELAPMLIDVRAIRRVNLRFRENDVYYPVGFSVSEEEAASDNYYNRNVQVPNVPNSTVPQNCYGIDFRRGWFVQNVTSDIAPVRYQNGMMLEGNEDFVPGGNEILMRWVVQQELGGTNVFFHEVTIPAHTVEGTHQHVGSEELYYVIEGEGVAYMGEEDDPDLANRPGTPTVLREIYGIGKKPCKQLRVQPGSVIYTKSGGIHGIANPNDTPLRFVAFLYHSA